MGSVGWHYVSTITLDHYVNVSTSRDLGIADLLAPLRQPKLIILYHSPSLGSAEAIRNLSLNAFSIGLSAYYRHNNVFLSRMA